MADAKKNYTIETRSPEETHSLAEMIGKWIDAGSIISLSGELGSGKTAFVQGLAKGLNVPEAHAVTSPTFTLINEYPGRHPLYHMDLYRLSGLDDLEDLGFFDIITGNGVSAIEWADKLPEHLLQEDLQVVIRIIDDTHRIFSINIYGQKNSLLINHFDLKINPIYE
jgi:tRNA threonylcarbamoyladenosine biosynthesis protein TsaE